MDSTKLIKSLSSKNQILVPHIHRFLAEADLPAQWIIKIANQKEKREYGEADIRFSPSSDTLTSVEDLVSKYTDGKPYDPISPNMRMTFDIGTMWHEYLQNIIKAMNFVPDDGVEKYFIKKIERPAGIAYTSGLGDLVGVNIPGHGSWLVDIKTMNKRSFDNPPIDLMQKYTAQINLYGDWFGYDKLMILAVSKDSPHDFKELITPSNPYLVNEIYDRWVEAYGKIKEWQNSGCRSNDFTFN